MGLITNSGGQVPPDRAPYWTSDDWTVNTDDQGRILIRVVDAFPGTHLFAGEDADDRKYDPYARVLIEHRPWSSDAEGGTYVLDVTSGRLARALDEVAEAPPSPWIMLRRTGTGTSTTYSATLVADDAEPDDYLPEVSA